MYGRHFSCVNVESVLALLGKTDVECDYVVLRVVRNKFAETFLFDTVLVERCHEIGELARHFELDFEFSAGKH